MKTLTDSSRRANPMVYFESLFNPILVPIYGLWMLFYPSKKMTEKHWHLKVIFVAIIAVTDSLKSL